MCTTIRCNMHYRKWSLNKYCRVQTVRCRMYAVLDGIIYFWPGFKKKAETEPKNNYCALIYAMRHGDLDLWIGRGVS